MGALKVVEALPDGEPAIQLLEPGYHHSIELPVELLVIDSVRSFSLPIQVGPSGPNVPMLDALIKYVPVKLRAELAAIVRLDAVNAKRQFGEDLVHKDDRGLLVIAAVDLEDSDPRAVVNRRVLLITPAAQQGSEEFDIDLQLVSGEGLLVAFVPLFPSLIAHV